MTKAQNLEYAIEAFRRAIAEMPQAEFDNMVAEIGAMQLPGPTLEEYFEGANRDYASLGNRRPEAFDDNTYGEVFNEGVGRIQMNQIEQLKPFKVDPPQDSSCKGNGVWDCAYPLAA